MKITPDNNTEMKANRTIDSQSAGNKSGLASADGLIPPPDKSDFASVLDRVTRSHNNAQDRSEDGKSPAKSETRDTKKSEEDDKGADDVNVTGVERTLPREPVAVDEVNTNRPILHSVDLDSIVTAYQVQLVGNGRTEVTLELSRSMLEGLRVKLTADGAGRITADFLAANEGVKTLLDGRSNELIEQLRSRGINLAEFRSSVAADANSRNDSQQQQPRGERAASGIESVASTNESETTNVVDDSLAAGATYRA